ncbi:HNH endonuclease [Jannaschia faecimaris]|uniref:HNH endonuclease n=1 Tax=Jannaschia faecimaris TaxID=1244108 RepID=A0A1H3RH87_9RHOB|nr:HNH endonuclease [Jannaschia faecimaris]SDZ24299.1 HNH endonuclease [Jannaschia faecimaris]
MANIEPGSWLFDLIEVYNELGGEAPYEKVYPLAQEKRQKAGASWTKQSPATIRRTVEDNAESSKNYRGRAVFYSVNGHGKGVWGLLPDYRKEAYPVDMRSPAYAAGIEGILQEQHYLRRSRDPKLVEQRKVIDDYTCQTCGFRLQWERDKYLIEVHHLSPLGNLHDVTVTSTEDLICLCPTCHRIAHTR